VGFFRIETILRGNPTEIWEKCKKSSGMEKKEFFEYFSDSRMAFAIKIKDLRMIEPFDPHIIFPDFSPPQSFRYTRVSPSSLVSRKVHNQRRITDFNRNVAAEA
jgi:predicted transcriptional regulator